MCEMIIKLQFLCLKFYVSSSYNYVNDKGFPSCFVAFYGQLVESFVIHLCYHHYSSPVSSELVWHICVNHGLRKL